jgi:hypothetical protein
MGKVCAMQSTCDLPLNRWDEFIVTTCYLMNRTPVKSQNGHTSYEWWYGTKPDLSHLHEIGCHTFTLIQNTHNPKVYDHSVECVLIDYSQDLKAYCLYHCTAHKVIILYHIAFIVSHQDTNSPLRSTSTSTSPHPHELPVTADPLTTLSKLLESPAGLHRSSRVPTASERSCAAQGIPYISPSRCSPLTATVSDTSDKDDPLPVLITCDDDDDDYPLHNTYSSDDMFEASTPHLVPDSYTSAMRQWGHDSAYQGPLLSCMHQTY